MALKEVQRVNREVDDLEGVILAIENVIPCRRLDNVSAEFYHFE